MKKTILVLSLLWVMAGTAPASAAVLGENPRLGENFLNTGIGQAAGDVNRDRLPGSCGSCLARPAECFVAPGGYLSSEEFSSMPRTGTVDASRIRFSQDSISPNFKGGGSVEDLTGQLKNGLDPSTVPPIRIVEKDGQIFTLDNRRLQAFQDAGVPIPYERLDSIPKGELFKFTTENGGTSITIRGGNQ